MILTDEILLAQNLELGKKTSYDFFYNPEKLCPLPREKNRAEIGIKSDKLPFFGIDHWNHFEVSWLNPKGKPIVALAEIIFNANSPNLIESKSMKLYFNSLNNTKFLDAFSVCETIKKDLESRVQSEVMVKINTIENVMDESVVTFFEGKSIDHLDIECTKYTVDPSLLTTENELAEETLYSDLLRSNCLVTGQPDWASVQITYTGKKINHASLLEYIVSYRNHTEFGEHCIERIFMDLMRQCNPTKLTIEGRYTRRGGIDINCLRSTEPLTHIVLNRRLCRQ